MVTQMEKRHANATDSLKIAVVYDGADRYSAMEMLPPIVRQMFADAPYDYSLIDLAKEYHAWYEEARYGDPFSFFVNGPATPDVWEFVANMDAAFRRDVKSNDYTGTNRDGSYKLVPKVHAQQKPQRKDVLRGRIRKPGRHSFFFPPIPTSRGRGAAKG